MLNESNSCQEPSVTRKTFILEQMHSCDRLSICMLTTKNWNQANYYILPPDHKESLMSSIIMDGCETEVGIDCGCQGNCCVESNTWW